MMKKVFLFVLSMVAVLISTAASACEIDFQVEQAKDSYYPREEVVVTVMVELTHRRCDVGLEETSFSTSGLEILSATKWVQVSSQVYARKLKVRISPGTAEAKIIAVRECDKEGGHGELKLRIS